MPIEDFEKLGQFYLGRQYDLAAPRDAANSNAPLVLYDAKDLTTHAVCVGMTGSGKTGLCLALLEEAAIDGLPAIAIDPKGDLGNLLLTFPQLRPEDFRPWIDEREAARKGITPDELAAQTAARWREGLAEWGEDGARIERFRSAVDIAIYTPGSSAGLPLNVLGSFDAPPRAIVDDGDLLRDRIVADVSGLLTLVGIDADPIRSRDHILLSQLLDTAWRAGQDVDLAALVAQIQNPPFERVGSLDLETFFPARNRGELAMRLNNLLASPGFAGWMEGEPLDVASLLYTPEGKPRLSILSIAHLSEAERMFFVTLLLNEVLSWVRTQSGTSSLRAILYMDEVFGYFPPIANPPSKTPMLTLLKQARAYGLGIVLATQNPVDLDYKGLSNAGTWFLGRLQTERDKARVLEGLEGASASAGALFDRRQMEATLAGLGSRVFLLNNVHEDRPIVFQSRWCLSYLRGPLTRAQIQTLMEPRKQAQLPHVVVEQRRADSVFAGAPHMPADVKQLFLVRGDERENRTPHIYEPALFGFARVHFVDAKAGVDCWKSVGVLAPVYGEVAADPWDGAELPSTGDVQTSETPREGVAFAPLPPALAEPKNYAAWKKSLVGHLYRNHTLTLWTAPALKEFSRPEESEAAFRIRIGQRVRELRDEALEKLRQTYGSKVAQLDAQIQKARERVAREKSQVHTQAFDTALSWGASIMQILFGRKLASVTNVRKGASAVRKTSRTVKQYGDADRAGKALEELLEKRAALEDEFEAKLAQVQRDCADPQIAPYPIRPRKTDLTIDRVVLAWVG